jgi:hypothetical protein
MSLEEKMKQIPALGPEADQKLREWVDSLDPDELAHVITRYGMDPGPAVARLTELQSDPMTEKMSVHIARLWLE